MRYSVTVIIKELGYRETVQVEAESEGKAKSGAIMETARQGRPSLSGQMVEYIVEVA
jgi:hypothetical protein